MAIIRFQTNITETFHLRSLDGKPVESQFGGIQYLFTAEEGTFYVSDKVGGILMDQFRKLSVKPGDPVEITKSQTGRGPDQRTQWIVAKSVTTGELQEPSELEQKLEASIAMVEQRKQAAQATTAQPAWASFLVEQSNALIDAYSKVLTHASQYPNVRGEDVRSIFLSTFINVSKGGNRNAA